MNFLKRINLFEVVLVVAILSLHLYAVQADAYAFPNNWFVRDDAYYYFKVAQNITEGHGSSFDGINLSNGYHPLWMLICIPIFALARFDVILPLRVLLVVIAIIQAATSVMLYRLVKKYLSEAVGILAAAFWSFNIYIHATVYELGLETPIAAFSIVFVLYQLAKFEDEWRTKQIPLSRFAWLGLAAAMAMFSRLDLVFFAVIVGGWLVFRGTSLRYLLPLDIALIFVSMTSAVLLRTDFNTYNSTYADSAIEATFIAIVVKVISLYFLGGYQNPRANSILKMLRQVFLALALSAVVIVGIYLTSVQLGVGRDFPRSAFILDFIISLVLLSASRLAAYWFANPSRINIETPLDQFKSKWKTWFTEGIAFYSVVGGLLLAYMIFNQAVFGTSTPVSGQIKRWWGSMANSAYERPASNWASYFGIGADAYETGQPFTEPIWQSTKYVRFLIPGSDKIDERFFFILSIAVLFWLVVVFFNKKYSFRALTKFSFAPLLASSIIHILSYTATSYGGAKEWYWVSQMILLTLAVSLAIDLILRPLQRIGFVRIGLIIAALLFSLSSFNTFWRYIDYAMPHGKFAPDRPYMEVVAYIEANVPTGEIIGMTGGGNVGYFIKDHTIVNLDGLINSNEYFQILKDGNAPVFLHNEGMTVIFANPRLLGLPPYYGQFSPYLERYDSYGGKDLMYLLPNPKY